MGPTLFENLHWIAGFLVEAIVFALALRHRVFERLPAFTAYLGLVIASEAIIWLAYKLAGISSHPSFYVYWIMQAVQLAVRAVVVYEICRVLLSAYSGIWRLCRPALIAIGAVLAATSAISASQNANRISAITLTAERGLELTIVCVLLCGLIFCRYYRISIEPYLIWIALGLGFYSAVQVANNTFLRTRPILAAFPMWADLREASFNITTILWLVALWKPLPARQPAPVLLARGEYEILAPQVTVRLRELNARLLEMWK